MTNVHRRGFVGSLAMASAAGIAAAGANASAQSLLQDGHAAGRDAAPFSGGTALLPRKPGDAPGFVASLDHAALKATSGGWAREITARQLPVASGIALAHLFMNAGGAREMHWHNCAEWAFVISGRAQATIVDPDGTAETFNVGPGDLWYFPRGYAHAIQTIGAAPCHALLAFDDGLYSEHGTFGISDVMSRIDVAVMAQSLGVPPAMLASLPKGETYINQGAVLVEDGPEAQCAHPRQASRTCGFRLLAAAPVVDVAGGTIRVASAVEFPASATMSGLLIRLAPDAMQEVHWHPDANEMHYVTSGRGRLTMFGPDKHLAIAEIGPGDCAYIPRSAAHLVQNTGPDPLELIAVQDAPHVSTATLSDWLTRAPSHLLANNLGLDAATNFHPGTQIAGPVG